eukprot:c24340_g1_i3 orf=304-1608(+)
MAADNSATLPKLRVHSCVNPKLMEVLSSALAKLPVSNFPVVPLGRVIEISADSSIIETVEILSKHNIFSAPVRNPNVGNNANWNECYSGIVDYGGVVLWVLEQAEIARAALAASSAAAAGMGAGAVGALGALALGATGPSVITGLTAVAIGAAVAGGIAVDRGIGKDAPSGADALGEDFYKLILQEEPFKSTQVSQITKSYRWTPFLPVQPDDSMLTLLLLLSKFQLRSVPVVEMDTPFIKNYITQSAVVKGLQQCQGRNWFEKIAGMTLYDLGLPVMAPEDVISVDANKLILEAFVLMREKHIGGLPVVEGESRKIIGNISLRDVQFLLLKPTLFEQHKSLKVLDFMKTVISTCKNSSSLIMMPAVTCTLQSILSEVIDTLSSKGIHRIHVVDDQSCVIGVVTLRDIISCFVSEPEHYFDGYIGGIAKSTFGC